MIKVGVIGTGGISGTHLQFIRSQSDLAIKALCDVNANNLERSLKQNGGAGYGDFRQMLDQEKLDAVWICTPPQVRKDPLIACAQRGIPVFCEKPVERMEENAAAIARELDQRKAKVQVGYVFRSMPVVAELRKEMKDDTIHLAQSFYGCGVSLDRSLPAWFYDKDLSGGALIDQATHNLDLLRSLFGEVREVRGIARNPHKAKEKGYTIDEIMSITLVFANGLLCSHQHTWIGDKWRNEMVFFGEKRIYRLNLSKGSLEVEDGGRKRVFEQGGRPIHHYQNETFLKMVQTGDWSANPSDYSDGLKTLQLTLACDKALECGRVEL